ncbi:hypothetical protein ABVT39_020215 [Epinephelus coioides]
MYAIIKTFNEYTGPEGEYIALTKKCFAKLLHTEFPEAEKNSAEVDRLCQLDEDGDGLITFDEFVSIITEVHMLSPNMAHLREVLELLTDTFKEYAGRGGDKNTMSKAEIRVMLRKKFPNANMDTAEMKHFFNKMDVDANMSRIADAMDLLMTTFHNYTGPQGNYITLTKNDFTKLLHEEFPEVDYSSDDMESFFSKLDANGDNAVSFKEFVDIITEFDLMCTSK